jgi:tetratricopeptide (TPR) repeat protein
VPSCLRALFIAPLIALPLACNFNAQKIAEKLDAGEVALGGGLYDSAISDADDANRLTPTAQAYYLRGRAEEDRPKPDANLAVADWEKARTDYQAALNLHPPKALAARCRAGLANIAFAQEDYAVATFQYMTALDDLEQPDWRANALYRIGEAQQRVGRFDDADKTFKRLESEYPDQAVTAKGIAREGVKEFFVQVGTFADLNAAQAALTTVQHAGLTARQIADQGLIAVRAGPYATYIEAEKAQATIAGQFPGAKVGP